MKTFDLIGSALSLTSTYYYIRLNSRAWMVGILATVINGWLFWQEGIYADSGLELIYFLSMLYGLYQWESNVKVEKVLSLKQWSGLGLLSLILFIMIYCFLLQFTSSKIPAMDATTTSLSLVAQGLMCHKIRATWLLWFVTDSLYALMYYTKHLPFHVGLMIFYSSLALIGYYYWGTKK